MAWLGLSPILLQICEGLRLRPLRSVLLVPIRLNTGTTQIDTLGSQITFYAPWTGIEIGLESHWSLTSPYLFISLIFTGVAMCVCKVSAIFFALNRSILQSTIECQVI